MQIGDDQGQLLTLLARLVGARHAVEVGTFTGYSSMCIARGLVAGGSLLCCDVSAEWTEIGRRAWAAAGLADRIELRIAPALDTLRSLPESAQIDLVFIDADKPGYAAYWAELVPRVRPGGLLLADNVLWSGRIADPEASDREHRRPARVQRPRGFRRPRRIGRAHRLRRVDHRPTAVKRSHGHPRVAATSSACHPQLRCFLQRASPRQQMATGGPGQFGPTAWTAVRCMSPTLDPIEGADPRVDPVRFRRRDRPRPGHPVSGAPELGIAHIELRSAWDVNVLDWSDEQLTEVENVLTAYSISVSSIGSPIGKINIEDDFDAHLLRMERALAVAQRLRAPYIRLFSFFLRDDQAPADHRDEVIRRMRALVDAAAGHDVVLLHENEKDIYGDVPDRVLDLVESVDSPQFKLAWDAANYVQCGVRPFTEGYDRLRPHVAYIQIKDALAATGEVVPAGEGDGEVRQTIHALRADGFDGFFSMEPHLGSTHSLGGFTGADLFIQATNAFTTLLDSEGIEYA